MSTKIVFLKLMRGECKTWNRRVTRLDPSFSMDVDETSIALSVVQPPHSHWNNHRTLVIRHSLKKRMHPHVDHTTDSVAR